MTGTTPTFYKVPVTMNLVSNVHHGQFPIQHTEVSACHVPVPRLQCCWSTNGMKPLDNRHAILCCYEAFKAIAEIND